MPVGAVHLDDADTGRGDVPSQAGAVAAGALDPDQAHGAEVAQPVQQAGVAGRGGRELLDSEQPADRIECRGDVHVGVGVHPAGDGACLYDGQRHPFLWLRDGTHPPAVGSGDPGLSHRTGRSDRLRRWCHKTWARPTDRLAGQHEAASAESEIRPGPRPPTLRTHHVEAGEAGPEALTRSSLPIRVHVTGGCVAALCARSASASTSLMRRGTGSMSWRWWASSRSGGPRTTWRAWRCVLRCCRSCPLRRTGRCGSSRRACNRSGRSRSAARTTRSPRCPPRPAPTGSSPTPAATTARRWPTRRPASASRPWWSSRTRRRRSRSTRYAGSAPLVDGGERLEAAEKLAAERDLTLIPPFDHPDVIAGQGSVGLEILADLSTVDAVLVPVGGGGLASGVSAAVKAIRPQTAVYGVEPDVAPDARDSLAAGRIVPYTDEQRYATIADGMRTHLSELTLAHLRAHLDGIVTVTEDEIRAAVGMLARDAHLVAEPSGATSVAAYRFHAAQLPAGRTVAVISGGNLDPALLAELVSQPR